MKDIFKSRVNILPYEYPQLLEYKDAIRHSYWIDTEFNFTEDIQDFKININSQEKDVIKKRFGIDEDQAFTLEEIGKEFNVTRERIRQIELKALKKLKKLRKSPVLSYLD